LYWLLSRIIPVGVIVLVVIFQPELRMALEQIGRGGLLGTALAQLSAEQRQEVLSEVIDAAVGGTFRQRIRRVDSDGAQYRPA